MKIPTHDGKGTIKFWGVRYVPEKRAIKKKFYRRDGTLDERLYAHETEQDFRRLEFDDGTPSLIENRRAAHYRAYVYILGKVWHLGVCNTPRKAAALTDSALFHLWGFFNNPKPGRFNLFTAEQYSSSPPPELPAVGMLRKRLYATLRREGSVPEAYDHTFVNRHNPDE